MRWDAPWNTHCWGTNKPTWHPKWTNIKEIMWINKVKDLIIILLNVFMLHFIEEFCSSTVFFHLKIVFFKLVFVSNCTFSTFFTLTLLFYVTFCLFSSLLISHAPSFSADSTSGPKFKLLLAQVTKRNNNGKVKCKEW